MTQLTQLLEASPAPAYAVDGRGVIVEANAALCEWVGLKAEAVVGRRVAYHSDPGDSCGEVLTGLCPPPDHDLLPATEGTLSTMGRDGRLRHRRARFLWLPLVEDQPRRGVLVVAESSDLTPQQLADALSTEPTQDELHRHVRHYRRAHSEPVATALLLGDSSAARRLRSQFDLAMQSTTGVAVYGECTEDTAALARAIHYARQDPQAQMPTVDCLLLDEIEVIRLIANASESQLSPSASLLLLTVDKASKPTQQEIAKLLRQAASPPRVLATVQDDSSDTLHDDLLALLGPVRIDSLELSQRIEDLPAISQFFVEQANAEHGSHLGGLSPDALDQLALYAWPHGVEQLGQTIGLACRTATRAQVAPDDFPAWVRQAELAATLGNAKPLTVDLESILEQVEREAIRRSLNQAGDNKAEAARLLGLTRQRFYRRLESLGLNNNREAPDA